jgi:hypothetical protein
MKDVCGGIKRNVRLESSKSEYDGQTRKHQSSDDVEQSEYSDPDFSDSEEDSQDATANTEEVIFRHLLRLECDIPRSSSRIRATQIEFEPIHRESAVKRIIQCNYHFQLTSDALYNAVCYFDIILSTIPICPTDFEFTAIVCYWLSAKFDTRAQPTIERINTFTGHSFTTDSFRALEVDIVAAMGFQLSYPTAKMFMRRIHKRVSATSRVIDVSNVLVEVALIKFEFVDMRPSIVAAAAIAVSWAAFGSLDVARSSIQESICSDRGMLVECMKTMVTFLERMVASQAALGREELSQLLASIDVAFDIDSLVV